MTPDGFDPARKYPMVVYFYEQHTSGLHGYSAPSGRNVINAPVYVNKGYLVFMPDIYYTEGYPGPSALKTIVPGDYPAGQGWQRPPHIHFKAQKRGFRELTGMVFHPNMLPGNLGSSTAPFDVGSNRFIRLVR